MRLALVTLVLIVGAAVILFFANTLNSWVLGGLIGGFAALLIGIPISLTIFSYFARHNDERLRAEIQAELALAQERHYENSQEIEEFSNVDATNLSDEQTVVEEDYVPRRPATHQMPAQPYPRLPAAGQGRAHSTFVDPDEYTPTPRQAGTSTNERRTNTTRHLASDRQNHYPGLPDHQSKSSRSRQQTAALRAARQEAIEQNNEQASFPSPAPRKPAVSRSSRQLPAQPPTYYRPGRTVDGNTKKPSNPRSLPAGGESSASHPTQGLSHTRQEPKTEQFRSPYPRTGPMRRQPPSTQTGQLGRNRQSGEQPSHPSVHTGSLKNPLVRRAPYMYEDDPLREQLSQQIDPPIIRRSTRSEAPPEEFEDF